MSCISQTIPVSTLSQATQTRPGHPVTLEQLQAFLQELKMTDATRKLTIEAAERQRKTLPPWFPQHIWDAVEKKIGEIDIAQVELPTYQRYFSQDNIDAMILFFQGPLGEQVAANYLSQRVAVARTGASGADADRETLEETTQNKEIGTTRLNELSPSDRQRVIQAEQVIATVWQAHSNELASTYDDFVNNVIQKEITAHNPELAAAQQAYNRKSSANPSPQK